MRKSMGVPQEDDLQRPKKLVVFGLGNYPKLISYYIETTTAWDIVCYTVDAAYISDATFEGRDVVAFEDITALYPPDEYEMLIAVGYRDMGNARKAVYERVVEKGYRLPNYIHPSAVCNASSLGVGNIVLENASIGPFSVIGNCNLIWNGVQLGHNATLGSFCTLCMGSVYGGTVKIGDNCFFGLNSTVINRVDIAPYTMLGAHSYLTRSTEECEALLSDLSAKRHRTRNSFEMMDHWMSR